MVVAQTLQNLGVCAVAALCFLFCRKVQILKQHLSELLRRIDVEFLTGVKVNRLLKLAYLSRKHRAVVGDTLSVHSKTDVFHLCENSRERNLDFAQQHFLSVRFYLVFELFAQLVVSRKRTERLILIPLRCRHRHLVDRTEGLVGIVLLGGLQQIRRKLHVEREVFYFKAVSVGIGKERLAAGRHQPDFGILKDFGKYISIAA